MSANALKKMSLPLFACEQIKHNLFWFISFKHSLGYVLQNRSFQKFRKTYKKTPLPEFLIKLYTIKPANLLKRDFSSDVLLWILRNCFKHFFYRTPPVSVSHFNSTFLALSLRRTYIYIFQALLGFRYF